jgi:hypothetical protein
LSNTRTGTQYNATVAIGTDYELRHTITDDLGVAVDLTSATLRALVKRSNADADGSAVATFTVSVVSAAAGTVKMVLPDTETAKLSEGEFYYYDLHVLLPAGHASYPSLDDTPLWGLLRATRITTRSTT